MYVKLLHTHLVTFCEEALVLGAYQSAIEVPHRTRRCVSLRFESVFAKALAAQHWVANA